MRWIDFRCLLICSHQKRKNTIPRANILGEERRIAAKVAVNPIHQHAMRTLHRLALVHFDISEAWTWDSSVCLNFYGFHDFPWLSALT